MEEEHRESPEELHQELDALDSRTTLSDKEAEARFIEWYEEICQERLVMLEAEEKYKMKISELETAEERYRTRIKELENSTIVLVKTFEEAQSEIKGLREKYEPKADDIVYFESYKAVALERDNLQKADVKNKRRIKKLESEVKQLRDYIKGLGDAENKDKNEPERKDPAGKLPVVISSERLEALEKENDGLKDKLEKLKQKQKPAPNTHVTETKIKTVATLNVKKEKSIKPHRDKLLINKKCIPTFLPRIENNYSGIALDTELSDRPGPLPFLCRSSQTPSLMFGLGYRDIYRKGLLQRSKSIDNTSLSSSQFDSLCKYIV